MTTYTEEKKQELALEIIQRLKEEYRTQGVPWIMTRHGNCWSVSVWLPSAQMPESMWL